MSPMQPARPGKTYDCNLECDRCGSLGESRRLIANSEPTLQEWLQPPNGWWVHLNESTLRVRCPDCQEQITQVPKPQTVSSICPSTRTH